MTTELGLVLPDGLMDQPVENRIKYRDFLLTREAELGSIITGVKPDELFTYQNIMLDEKALHVIVDYYEPADPRLDLIDGYLYFHPSFDRNVMVIGNGHHRAFLAKSRGKRIDVQIIKTPNLKAGENPARFTNLWRKYGNIYAGYGAALLPATNLS